MRKIRILPIALLFALLFLVDFYAWRGLAPLLQVLNGKLQPSLIWLYWLISTLILGWLVASISYSIKAGSFTRSLKNAINTTLISFVTKLVFVLVLLLGDVGRLLYGVVSEQTTSRSALFVEIALIIAAIPLLAFIHGVTKGKYRYKVHKVELKFDDLPEAFEAFKVVQISDVHAGSFDNEAAVERGIKMINEQNADLFVFTGDLVNNKAEEIEPWIDKFSKITAPYGKYSILGNHDYGDYIQWDSHHEKAVNLEHLKKHHADMGFELLLDQHAAIFKDGERITLLGVENWGLGFGQRGDIKKALAGVNAKDFKILLSHDPTHWQSVIKELSTKIHITLSGHTHGMQFGIEALGIKWSPVKFRYPHWAGLAEYNDRYLYINRGFGFLGFSGRVGIWPEITVITLRKGYGAKV